MAGGSNDIEWAIVMHFDTICTTAPVQDDLLASVEGFGRGPL